MTKPNEDLMHREEVLRVRLSDEGFLKNTGLGNEVGIYILCYDPTLELEARAMLQRILDDSENGRIACRVTERNLYDLLLQICEGKRILDHIPQQEERRGSEALLNQLKKSASDATFAKAIADSLTPEDDVLLITGVGEVYPFLRIHNLLDNLQPLVGDIPIIVAYPGIYTGQFLSLFDSLEDGNYYRAFNLL